jgi:hypothetical protein
VQLRQKIGLADLDHVGKLHVPFLHVDHVKRRIEMVSEVHGVATGALRTLRPIGREKNAINVNHGGTGRK